MSTTTAIIYNWDKATIRVRVPVYFTATSDVAEIDVPIRSLAKLLAEQVSNGSDDLPLAIIKNEESKGAS